MVTEDNLGVTTTYGYDADNQLTSEMSPVESIGYSYDAAGNRNGAGDVIGPGNQLLSDGVWNYTYDAAGNLIQKVGVSPGPDKNLTWTYTYDNLNALTSAVETTSGTATTTVVYDYDALGNRIEEDATINGARTQVTRFAYDGQNVWADLNGSNTLVTRRLFLNAVDEVIARISSGGTVAWYLTDRLGSVRALVNSTGAIIDQINYDGFGNIISESNPSESDRYLWTGREFDRVTGLQYNRARYYDPVTGRWITPDPSGIAAGDTNLYRYVKNDPTNLTDPSGRQPRTTKELEALRKQGRYPTATKSLETPLTAAELVELKDLLEALKNKRPLGIKFLRLEELQIQFQNAGANISGVKDLEVLKKIIGTSASLCPKGTLPGRVLKTVLGFYEKGIGIAIKGITKIDEELYNQYVAVRNGGAPHEEILLPGFRNEATSERYRLRYELAKLQAQLAAARANAQSDEDDLDEEEEEWYDDLFD